MMNSVTLTNASALIAKQFKLIHLQRIVVCLLLLSLTAAVIYAHSEKRRAEQWRAETIRLQSQLSSESEVTTTASAAVPAVEAVQQEQDASKTRYYVATLIGEDGSRTSLTGKAIQIDLGGRLLNIDLARGEKDKLFEPVSKIR